jgi:hypothetical protein
MASRRLEVLQAHLGGLRVQEDDDRELERQATSAAATTLPPPDQMFDFLTRDNKQLRGQIFEFLKDPLYRPNYYLSMQGFRDLTSKRVAKFVGARFFSVFDYVNDPLKFQAALECLSFCDYSLAIKSGVHFTLCGGTIAKLGTEKHHDVLRAMDTLELPGSFGMTELGHGSNVMGIETTAVYDPASQARAGEQMRQFQGPPGPAVLHQSSPSTSAWSLPALKLRCACLCPVCLAGVHSEHPQQRGLQVLLFATSACKPMLCKTPTTAGVHSEHPQQRGLQVLDWWRGPDRPHLSHLCTADGQRAERGAPRVHCAPA